jgi:hypothetical protein
MRLYDSGGCLIRSLGQVKEGRIDVYRRALPPGIYIYELVGKQVFSGRMIIR